MAISTEAAPRRGAVATSRDLPVGAQAVQRLLALTLVLGLVVACLFFTVATPR